MRAPARIYLELWPGGAGRENSVHFEPLGYGIDMTSGAHSRIVEYARVTKKRVATKKRARTPERPDR